jgi:hypothetical protein
MTFPGNFSRDCIRAWEAMPWSQQGSITQANSEWLRNHLASCAACRAEFEQQRRLRVAMSLPCDIPVDANVGLKRLLDRLDEPDPQRAPLRAQSGNWLFRTLVAAVLIQTVGVGILGVKLWSASEGPAYRTLSEESLSAAPGAIRVVPDASMTLADWNALLHALRLQVVGGPNDVGAYTVAPASSASTSQHALQQLRATRGIRLAEPVTAMP